MDKESNSQRRVALVTGASGNLGQVVCARLVADGLEVVRVERTRALLGGHTLAPVDLSSAAATEQLVARVVEQLGRLDVVVHTVGTFQGSGKVAAAELT